MPPTKQQKDTVGRVMHEFKHGELKTSTGKKVRNPKQAIAIGLHEAGASKQESDEDNQHSLSRTNRRERRGETARARDDGNGRQQRTPLPAADTKAELYELAKQRGIAGRSKMSKEELAQALGR